jgi:hypothetical protein
MRSTPGDVIVLRHRHRPLPPMAAKVLLGLAAIAAAVVGMVLLARRDGSTTATVLASLASVVAFVAGAYLLVDGSTDLIARWMLRDIPRRVMRLHADGFDFSPSQAADHTVSVPWSAVTACASRPGLGPTVFFCVDAPSFYPPPPAGHGNDPTVDPDVVRMRAHVWSTIVHPGPLPPLERQMLADTYVFGTPFAVNLAVCGRVDRARLARALHEWTGGRCTLDD